MWHVIIKALMVHVPAPPPSHPPSTPSERLLTMPCCACTASWSERPRLPPAATPRRTAAAVLSGDEWRGAGDTARRDAPDWRAPGPPGAAQALALLLLADEGRQPAARGAGPAAGAAEVS